jgi:hypothetical protein
MLANQSPSLLWIGDLVFLDGLPNICGTTLPSSDWIGVLSQRGDE